MAERGEGHAGPMSHIREESPTREAVASLTREIITVPVREDGEIKGHRSQAQILLGSVIWKSDKNFILKISIELLLNQQHIQL